LPIAGECKKRPIQSFNRAFFDAWEMKQKNQKKTGKKPESCSPTKNTHTPDGHPRQGHIDSRGIGASCPIKNPV